MRAEGRQESGLDVGIRRASAVGKARSRGQALIIAIFILALLMAVAVSFFTTTRIRFRQAMNIQDSVQADLVADAGIALAQAFLMQDAIIHKTYTSYDHAFRSYFNGAWIADKQWAFGGGNTWLDDRSLMPSVFMDDVAAAFPGLGNRHLLYVPRYQGNTGVAAVDMANFTGAFVLTDDYAIPYHDTVASLPLDQVDKWADVDVDGDGLRDAMWIPIARDKTFTDDGLDNDLDGLIDEGPDMGTDGVDNDNDGTADEADEVVMADGMEPERGIFVYFGGDDGLDNDGDGDIDEADEQKLFLTAPLGSLGSVSVDYMGASVTLDSADVDVLDNDYTLVINDYGEYQFDDPDGAWQALSDWDHIKIAQHEEVFAKAYNDLHSDYIPGGARHYTFTGEPVCEVIGRVAVLIEDVAGKAPLNVGNAMVFDETAGTTVPALSEGLGPQEYDFRILPDIGVAHADKMATLRYGAAEGIVPSFTTDPFEYDLGLPGYGRVDDNGDALWLALSGIDEDGDGWPFDGIRPDGGVQYWLEGIDDPFEYTPFKPLRNLIAEGDGFDNDSDDSDDEVGEFGDTYYHTRYQVDDVDQIAATRTEWLKPYVTPFSFDRNDRFSFKDAADPGFAGIGLMYEGTPDAAAFSFDPLVRTPLLDDVRDVRSTGLKLDYNYALADEIIAMLIEDWAYPPLAPYAFGLPSAWLKFATGLLREDIRVGLGPGESILGGNLTGAAADMIDQDHRFRAHQIGLNMQDARDPDNTRTESTVYRGDPWWQDTTIGGANSRTISYKFAGLEGIRINEIMVRAVRRVEAEVDTANPALNPNHFSAYPTPDFDVRGDTFASRIDPAGFRTIFPAPAFGEVPIAYSLGGGVEFWDPYVPDPANPTTWSMESAAATPLLGDLTCYTTEWSNLGVMPPNPDDPANPDLDPMENSPGQPSDTLQFLVAPGPGLPPGRYYLMVNTCDETGQPTVTAQEDLEYAVKYVWRRFGLNTTLPTRWNHASSTGSDPAPVLDPVVPLPPVANASHFPRNKEVGDTDILRDEYASVFEDEPDVPWQKLSDSFIGRKADVAKTPTGWVFLPTRLYRNPTDDPSAPAGTYDPPGPQIVGYEQDDAYTIEIPPYAGDPADQVYLCVAFRKPRESGGGPLSINFLDFSQEPDHEWIELVNTAEPDPYKDDADQAVNVAGWQLEVGCPGVEDRAIMTIPGDPHDPGRGTLIAAGSSILLCVDKFDMFDFPKRSTPGITFPDPLGLIDTNGMGMARGDISYLPDFFGGAFLSFVTVPPIPVYYFAAPAVNTESVFERIGSAFDFVDWDGDGQEDAAAVGYDDSVQSSRVGGWPDCFQEYNAAAGWALPTKPWDRIVEVVNVSLPESLGGLTSVGGSFGNLQDIDTLAKLVLGGGVFPNYPEHDGIDNDNDDAVLRTDGVDNDGDGSVDEASEGFDEGARPSGGVLPGAFSNLPVSYTVNPNGTVSTLDPAGAQSYMGGPGDSPHWKAFAERRFFPGDCVFVTLYDGPAVEGRIVDRVTYTERDVVNRSVNDHISTDVNSDSVLEFPPLNTNFDTFWPDNTMGVDFYRSLERKHPLFMGDRFGTTNRWEAIDGNYDDWDSSFGNMAFWLGVRNEYLLFGHVFSGSPLRMNMFQRELDDPDQFGGALPADAVEEKSPGVTVAQDRARVRNRKFGSGGDLLSIPHFAMETTFANWSGVAPVYPYARERVTSLFAGRDFPLDVAALLAGTTSSSQTLAAGQADFYPLYPTPAQAIADPSLVQTVCDTDPDATVAGLAPDITQLPQAWTPIFLVSLGEALNRPTSANLLGAGPPADRIFPRLLEDNYPVQLNFLLQTPTPTGGATPTFPTALADGDLLPRWPLGKRPVMYISANPADFDQGFNRASLGTLGLNERPSEALFVWDIEDGVENGTYDVYVLTMEPLDTLRTGHEETHRQILGGAVMQELLQPNGVEDGFAAAFLAEDERMRAGDMAVDIEFFTDIDGDRRCWRDANTNGYPDLAEVNTGGGVSESFGMLTGATPNSEGIVHYGIVTVQNNFLGMCIRNWARPGLLNRFSRVILAPRDKTLGRVNINTVYTRETDGHYYNPLEGVAGILADTLTFTPFVPDPFDPADDIGTRAVDCPPISLANSLDRARMVMRNRPAWVDGRYYLLPGDLAASEPMTGDGVLYPNALTTLADDDRFAEVYYRFSRMANMVTTRSDVFDITVIAQSGYIGNEDVDGNGLLDWRRDFVVMGEKRNRTVYER